MSRSFRLASAIIALAAPAVATATTLDFDSHAAGGGFSGTPAAGTAISTEYAPLGIIFGKSGVSTGVGVVSATGNVATSPNGVCGLDAAGQITANCSADIYFHFVDPANIANPASVNSLSFSIGDGGGDTDSWNVYFYDALNTLISMTAYASPSYITVAGGAGVSSVWIENTTPSNAGYLLDDLSFDLAPVSEAVPEPAMLGLFGMGALALALSRRRRA